MQRGESHGPQTPLLALVERRLPTFRGRRVKMAGSDQWRDQRYTAVAQAPRSVRTICNFPHVSIAKAISVSAEFEDVAKSFRFRGIIIKIEYGIFVRISAAPRVQRQSREI